MHALAQLPDNVMAVLPRDVPSRGKLELLVAAYGTGERLTFGSVDSGGDAFERLMAGDATFGELVEGLSGDGEAARLVRGDDSVFRGHRIAVVTNIPAHYRVPLLNLVASRLQHSGAGFAAFFCARGTRSRPWLPSRESLEFEHEFLSAVAVPVRARPPLIPLTLEAALRRFRPTIVLSAGFSPAVSGRCARYARRARIPFGVWSGEHDQMKTARNRIRRAQRRRLLARADFALAYGSASGRYLRALAPALPTVIGRNTAPLPERSTAAAAQDRPVSIVAIGDLTDERKGIDIAIDAIRARPDLDCRLRVIGGGTKLPALEIRAGRDSRIQLAGPRTPEETRDALGSADLFLFPTRADIFGLTMVEAMGAGTCAVVSSAAGAVHDLCVDRVNCVVVRGDQPDSWANAVAELTLNEPLRREIGARGRTTILRRWTIEHAADAMIAGLRLPVLVRGTR